MKLSFKYKMFTLAVKMIGVKKMTSLSEEKLILMSRKMQE